MSDDTSAWPTVSVVMPVRNEAGGLADAVASVLHQRYPGRLDVYLAVGPSHDGTEAVAADLARADTRIHVVDNPAGLTPAGLNAAIRASDGDIVVRVDGHARLSDGYVRRAVETLLDTEAVNVGGVQHAIGTTPFERAVAVAMTSRFGTGGARFHVGGVAGPVDTVYLGVFRRDALEGVGLFDESLVRNQDYELNIRLRAAGGTVWFDPALAVVYRPRGTVRRLAHQYFEYGWWKAVVARRHPESLRARQVAPAAATVAVGAGVLLAPRWRRIGLVPLGYLIATAAVSVGRLAQAPSTAARLVVVYPTMHLSWGAGFVCSLAAGALRSLRCR